ncbi:MAG: alkaline phosphatase family protein [Allosphingosinicella sp.]
MMKPSRLAAFLAVCLLPAAPAAAQPPSRPKLVVVISVDQFSADLFNQYRQHFDAGLHRLSEGVVFPMGYQSHNATETCPGHSTILTGSHPARTGIIANNWIDQKAPREDKNVYCAEDESLPGTSHDKYIVSPRHLKMPVLGDYMKRANPASRVAVASGKDRAAIMMGGASPDQRWYWNGKEYTGEGTPPAAAVAVNRDVVDALSRPREPRPLSSFCATHSRAVAVAGGGKPVGEGRFARAAGDRTAFRASPDFDRATLALGEGLRREMRLGESEATDLLILGMSATDYVGHTYGTQGSEMCLQLMALDDALGEFFRGLDATGIDYVVMLTADHGGLDIPERHRDHAAPDAARVDNALNVDAMGKALAARLKLQGPVLLGDGAFGDMYVDASLPAGQRAKALREAIAAYKAHPQVAAVWTRAELLAAPAPKGSPDTWSLLDRAKASFDPQRSGDFIVQLKPRVTPIFDTGRGYVATHGSPWDYDRRVPILFWRKGLRPYEQPLPVETVDILPTLAALIGVSVDMAKIDGRCLDLDEGPGTTCPAGWERR